MRTGLKLLRVSKNLTQQQMADRLCCSRGKYALIEKGQRDGKPDFWDKVQNTFNVSDADMWQLIKRV